jgi:hypothetical protein
MSFGRLTSAPSSYIGSGAAPPLRDFSAFEPESSARAALNPLASAISKYLEKPLLLGVGCKSNNFCADNHVYNKQAPRFSG